MCLSTFARPALFIAIAALAPILKADWKEDIKAIPADVTSGAGVAVAQIEAGNFDGFWAPMPTGELAHQTFLEMPSATTVPSNESDHAHAVGAIFYGENSMTPFVDLVYRGYSSQYSEQIGGNGLFPAPYKYPFPWKVENHSYTAGGIAPGTMTLLYDIHLASDNAVGVSSADNQTGPPNGLFHATCNGIVVGSSTGIHRTGLTPAALPLPGRTKPDIVGPAMQTSYTAPMVASTAAALISRAKTVPALADAIDARVIKATVLTCATTAPFPNWSNTETRPLDSVYGAGLLQAQDCMDLLNYYSGHQLAVGGTRGRPGWNTAFSNFIHLGSVGAFDTQYVFRIGGGAEPDTYEVPFSATIAWFSAPVPPPQQFGTWSEKLSDLNLELWLVDDFAGTAPHIIKRSVSPVDSVEHIRTTLKGGIYMLVVASPLHEEVQYGLAAYAPQDFLHIVNRDSRPVVDELTCSAPVVDATATVAAPTPVTFGVKLLDDTNCAFQWRKDGTAIAGATAASLEIPAAAVSDAGQYNVEITNPVGTRVSAATTLAVIPPLSVTLSSSPATNAYGRIAAAPGSTVTITANAAGASAPTFQWYRLTSPIAGATAATLSIQANSLNTGAYHVVVTDGARSASSLDVVLMPLVGPPVPPIMPGS